MIGTSDGEQYDSSFEHTVASRMPAGASVESAGALIEEARYPGSPQPLGRPQSQYDKDALEGLSPENFLLSQGYQKLDEGDVRDPSKSPRSEEGLGGLIVPDNQDNMDSKPVFGNPAISKQNINLNPNVASVLSQPHIAEAIANPKIDRSHDVPYEAGASAKPDDFTTHIDKSIPTSVTLSGQTFDPAIPANIHEQTEREVMNNLIKKGMSNEKAYEIAHHEYAEPAEDAWYRANGIKVEDANKWWASQDKTTEKETASDKNFPKDLYKKPYPHNEVEGQKHEPSGVAAEWPIRGATGLELNTPKPPGQYDKLPMSTNIEDRRNEVSDMAKHAKSLEDLIDQLETMGKLGTPEDRAKYYKEMDKPENVTDPLSRKSGILDLIEQIRKLNENK